MSAHTGTSGKVFGLILKPKTATSSSSHANAAARATSITASAPRRVSAFGSSVDDADGEGGDVCVDDTRAALARVQAARRAEAAAAAMAAEADTATYDYDTWKASEDVSRAEQKRVQVAAAREHREARYIGSLLATAEERKFAREVAYERQQAREREAEEAEFGKTEEFVTSTYQAKLEERRQREEEAARLEAAETADPLKRNRGAFFRNMLEAQLGAHAGDSVPEPVTTSATASRADARRSSDVARAAPVHEELRGIDPAPSAGAKRGRGEEPREAEAGTHREDAPAATPASAPAAPSSVAPPPPEAAPIKRYAPGERRTPEAEIEAARQRAIVRFREREAAYAAAHGAGGLNK